LISRKLRISVHSPTAGIRPTWKPPGCGSSQKYRFGRKAALCMESGSGDTRHENVATL
jgi:hypothetical protein